MTDRPFGIEFVLAKRLRAEIEERSGMRLELPLSGHIEQVAAEHLHRYGLERYAQGEAERGKRRRR